MIDFVQGFLFGYKRSDLLKHRSQWTTRENGSS
jgi:hypothetical protein